MIFIFIALLVAAGLALVVNGGIGNPAGLTEQQTLQLIPLIIILVLVASGAFGRRQNFKVLATGAVLWSALFATAIGIYAYRNELTGAKDRIFGAILPSSAYTDPQSGRVTFQRGFGGSFLLAGEINGVPVQMIFDTGATAVVLTDKDARLAGIDTTNLRYLIPVETANGRGRAAQVTLKDVSVGAINRKNVRAFVAEPEVLATSLLGMTFLETLSGYAVERDALELRD